MTQKHTLPALFFQLSERAHNNYNIELCHLESIEQNNYSWTGRVSLVPKDKVRILHQKITRRCKMSLARMSFLDVMNSRRATSCRNDVACFLSVVTCRYFMSIQHCPLVAMLMMLGWRRQLIKRTCPPVYFISTSLHTVKLFRQKLDNFSFGHRDFKAMFGRI